MAKLTYIWTPVMDMQLRQAYAKLGPKKHLGAAIDLMVMATGFPRHNVKERAQRLGVTVRTNSRIKPWTDEDTMCLRAWMGQKSLAWIARQLRRSTPVILRHMDELMFEAGALGYTRERCATILGVDRSIVTFWIFKKELALNEYDRISKGALETFLTRRHDWVDLRMMDQRYLHRYMDRLISHARSRERKQAYLVKKAKAA